MARMTKDMEPDVYPTFVNPEAPYRSSVEKIDSDCMLHVPNHHANWNCKTCRFRRRMPDSTQYRCTNLRMVIRWQEHMRIFRDMVNKGNRFCRHWKQGDD